MNIFRNKYLKYFIAVFLMFYSWAHYDSAFGLKIADFLKTVRPGEWIEMKSTDGLITRTTVIGIKDGLLEVEITSSQKGKIISQAREFINIQKGKIVLVKVTLSDGEEREVYPEEDAEDFMSLEFKKRGEDIVKVPAGQFKCEWYRAIYDDYVIDAWISENVPVIRLVKIKTKGGVASLINYGVIEGEHIQK